MTPREQTVLRAVVKSLRAGKHADMDALALSYRMPEGYADLTPDHRAAEMVQALIDSKEEG